MCKVAQSNIQYSLFNNELQEVVAYKSSIHFEVKDAISRKFCDYTIKDYISDIECLGLGSTWDAICKYLIENGENGILQAKSLGELYEVGLAIQNKHQKKHNGQYYTPCDVSRVMSEWLDSLVGCNVCDVATGTGNLIIEYLNYIGENRAKQLIKSGRLFLYDEDSTALKICKTIIMLKYGEDTGRYLNIIEGDFLNANVSLPNNCKVISNPPYCAVSVIGNNWASTSVLNDTKELYALFMEKIIKQSRSSVIITPYSFISSNKFYALRRVMSVGSGAIFAFDNIPGNIFCGKKHGVFNTNTMNSVRSAITVTGDKNAKGYRVTPLIRFKRSQRDEILKCSVLESFLGNKKQIITDENKRFIKCFKSLENIYDKWLEVSKGRKLCDIVYSAQKYALYIPNTCRYFTVASIRPLKRGGQHVLYFDNEVARDYIYCMINSSFSYWWWRLFDGGITYTRSLLLDMPIFIDVLSESDKVFFTATRKVMTLNEQDFIVTKNNVGIQENIKFPKEYRDNINNKLLNIIGVKDAKANIFDVIHSNAAMEITL